MKLGVRRLMLDAEVEIPDVQRPATLGPRCRPTTLALVVETAELAVPAPIARLVW